jgi:acyl-CoA thioester hydrolase
LANPDTPSSSPLPRYRAIVLPEWTDRNEHLNNAFYLVLVQEAYIQALKTWRGEGHLPRTSTGSFTMQSLVTYLREIRKGARVEIVPRLLGLSRRLRSSRGASF